MAKDYEIGYGKPPRHTQFKKGQSGNPRGRPKGTQNFKTDVRKTLNEKVQISQNGRIRQVSTQAATLMRLKDKALKGDARALDRLLILAQTYNNDEASVAMSLSTGDDAILEIFKSRVLRGATDVSPDDGAALPATCQKSGNDDGPLSDEEDWSFLD